MFNMRYCLFLCGLTVAAGAYPMTFAFENEDFVPVAMTEGNPDFSYEAASDPGGYVYYGAWTMTLFPNGPTPSDMPYTPHKTMHSSYLLVITYALAPINPLAFWNCSINGLKFAPEDFLGVIDNKKICEVGSCCKDFHNMPAFADDAANWHTVNTDKNSGGLCPVMTEETYCMEILGHANENCLEYFAEYDKLLTPIPCVDTIVRFYLSCTVFKTAMATRWIKGGFEPESYWNQQTNEQVITMDSTMIYSELRLCSPHSYYHPEDVKSPASNSNSDADESAAYTVTLLSAALFLFLQL